MDLKDKKNSDKSKIGVFLGTFDPIHKGHIHIAKNVIEELNLDSLIIIPSYESPHKDKKIITSSDTRLAMCRLACEGYDNIFASDIEIKNELRGYSLDKINLIVDTYRDSIIYYIVGSDAYMNVMEWSNIDKMVEKVVFCVVLRKEDHREELSSIKDKLSKIGGKTYICNFKTLEISSSKIKSLIKAKEDISDYLPATVVTYIRANKFYE